MKRIKNVFTRRDFLKTSAFVTGSAAGAGLLVGANPELEAAPAAEASATRTTALAQCPYCGVGCGTVIQVENGKIILAVKKPVMKLYQHISSSKLQFTKLTMVISSSL